MQLPEGVRVFFSYLDDSASDEASPILVFGGIVVDEAKFRTIELDVGLAVLTLIPNDRLHRFERFHAAELFNDKGVFAGLPGPDRLNTLRRLISIPQRFDVPYFYAAIHKPKLKSSTVGSAAAADIGFRMCVAAMNEWLRHAAIEEIRQRRALELEAEKELEQIEIRVPLNIYLVDECDKYLKDELKKSFRRMRKRVRPPFVDLAISPSKLSLSHDSLYFGDSRDSVGLQVADACNYFMMRHLRDQTTDDEFVDVLKAKTIAAPAEEEWLRTSGIVL